MTKTVTKPRCVADQCRRPATHYRRYEMTEGNYIHEFYRPFCEQHGESHWRAPRIPLSEVC